LDTKLTLILGLILNIVILPLALKRVIFLVRLITGGQPAPDRIAGVTSRVSKALTNQLVEVLGQKKLLKWSIPGIAHSFVMYAFLILGTVYVEAYGILISTDPHWKIPLVGDWWILGFGQDLIGVLCLVGLATFAIIRYKNQPAKLGRASRFKGSHTGGAWVVLIMIFNVIWTMFLFRGAAAAADNLPYGSSSAFFSHGIGNVINSAGLHHGDAGLEVLEGVGLLLHIGIMLVFLIIVLNSKHLHIFVAPINIMFKRPDGPVALGTVKEMISDGKPITLEDVEELDEETVLGIGSIEDFSWKGLLDMASCTECGRCQSQCPAWNTEKPLSPKMLIMNLRDHAFAKAPYLMTDEDKRDGLSDEVKAEAARPLVGVSEGEYAWHPEGGAIIDNDVLWSCTNCGACVNQCPVDIEHVDHIVDMRRYQVLVEANFPAELNGLFKGLENKGNPWNMNPNARMEWAQGLPFDVKVVGEDVQDLTEVEWLFWVGCAGAYEDRAKKTTRAVAELLDMAGVSFAVLGNGETCTGDSARRAGNEFVFQALAQQNIETFQEHKVKKVVSTCAHCFNTLKNEYKQFGIELEVVHHTQLLNRLVREKKLTPVEAPGPTRQITYHDPCFLGRHNQVYSPPRELLQVIPGAEFKEMPRNSERSFCCGAGGARMWMEETIGERINVNRTVEAVATGADQIAVGCPFCRTMLEDGLTSEQDAGRAGENVEVLDVAQLLLASVKGEGKKVKAEAKAKAPASAGATATATVAEPEAPAAAPASGGSLFDAAPAAPAKPAESGGSLFDTPAPAAPAAKPAETGGSLFDTPAPEAEKPAAKPAETGGSLFDLAPAEPAAPKAEAPAPTVVEPAETPAAGAPAEPKAEIPSGGSLFDIKAAVEAKAEESAEQPDAKEPAAEPEAEPEAAAEPEEKPAPPASSGEAHQPKTDTKITEGGSLFDL